MRPRLRQAIAFALVNLAWAVGQTAGAAGSARLAEAAGTDRVPFLALTLVCAASFAVLWRARTPVAAAHG